MNMKKSKLIFSLLLGVTVLSACGSNPSSSDNPTSTPIVTSEPNPTSIIPSESSDEPSNTSEVVKQNFMNIIFNDSEITYDGLGHSLDVSGAPENTSIVYTNKGPHANVGDYVIGATLSKQGYNNLVVSATLTIIPAEFEGITFTDQRVEFDGEPHSITITGNLPSGTTVVYSQVNGEGTNSFTQPGEYRVQARLTNANFETLELEATLTISSSLDDLYSYVGSDGKLYFQNALHKEYLYSYDDVSGLAKVNSDKAQYFTEMGGFMYYVSTSMLSNIITRFNMSTGQRELVAQFNAKDLVSDASSLYYIGRSFLTTTGVYKLGSDNEGNPLQITLYSGKASNLIFHNNKLYFLNADSKLCSINITTENQTPTIILNDYKLKNLYLSNGVFYFTVNELLGDYLAKYSLATSSYVKLTSDAAGSMAVIGNYIYYTNVDLLNAALFGKGIYRTRADITISSSLSGTKYIEDTKADYELTSLKADGNDLYFYRVFDKSIYKVDTIEKNMVNLLDGFTAPEDVIVMKDGVSEIYGTKLYYQNIYDGDKLYSYDTVSKTNTRITSSPIDDLYIYGNELYYRQISFLVNKDLYKINLLTSNPPVLVSTNDAGELEVYKDKIYYVNYTGSNTINRMNLDGSNDVVLYAEEAYNLRAYNDRLYFVINSGIYSHGWMHYLDISTATVGAPIKMDNNRTSTFEIYDSNIYFRRLSGFNYATKTLAKTDLNGNNLVELKTGVDPYDFAFGANKIYYYNDVLIGTSGLHSFDLSSSMNTFINSDYASSIRFISGKLYYYNHRALLGDSHLYELNLTSNIKTRIDTL